MDQFVNLHCHSEYSLLDGMPTVDEYVQWAADNGQPGIAITDHGAMGGANALLSSAAKHGVKGIVGIEAYVVPQVDKRVKGETRYHITLLAKDWTGVQNLFRLSSRAWKEGMYFRPRIQTNWLREYSEGVICLSGCIDGMLSAMVHKNCPQHALKIARQLRDIYGDRFFIEVMPGAFSDEDSGKSQVVANKGLVKIAKHLGIPLVATPDSHYFKEWQPIHKIYLGIGSKGRMWEFSGDNYHPMTRGQMETMLLANHPDIAPMGEQYKWWAAEACDNTVKICEMVDYSEMPSHHNLMPQPYPGLTDDEEYDLLVHLTAERFLDPKWDGKRDNAEYRKRLAYELNYIRDREFTRYFLLVDNMFQECVIPKGIMYGPGRGSSAGSLVCAILGITDPDPIESGLMFERFLAVSRVEPPDIDMDFEDDRRQEIKDWLINKYGQDAVASIGNYGTLGSKMVLKDVARCLKIPSAEVNRVSTLITPDTTVIDVLTTTNLGKQLCDRYPELKNTCAIMESRRRHKGIHASAMVLSPFPLTDMMPTDVRDGTVATAYYDKECGHLGFLKLDILGIKTLTIIRKACEATGTVTHKDLLALDYSDQVLFDEFHKGNTEGVFQYNSDIAKKILVDMPITCFEDLVAVNALIRPGALRSGMTDQYTAIARGDATISDVHPIYDEIVSETKGQLLYQEQIMQIFGQLGNYDPAGVERMRQMIKDMPGADVFAKERPMFVEGAESHGMTSYTARELFKTMIHFGSYAFNKSHAWVYSQIGYWCMHLKYYYPVEWACAMLNCEKESTKYRAALRDAVQAGIKIFLPDLNHSTDECRIIKSKSGAKAIKLGIKHLKGFGPKAMASLIENAPYSSYEDMEERTESRVVNKTVRETCRKLDLLGSPARAWNSDYLVWKDHYPLPVNLDIMSVVDDMAEFAELPWQNIEDIAGKSGSIYVRGVVVSVNKKNLQRQQICPSHTGRQHRSGRS